MSKARHLLIATLGILFCSPTLAYANTHLYKCTTDLNNSLIGSTCVSDYQVQWPVSGTGEIPANGGVQSFLNNQTFYVQFDLTGINAGSLQVSITNGSFSYSQTTFSDGTGQQFSLIVPPLGAGYAFDLYYNGSPGDQPIVSNVCVSDIGYFNAADCHDPVTPASGTPWSFPGVSAIIASTSEAANIAYTTMAPMFFTFFEIIVGGLISFLIGWWLYKHGGKIWNR